MIDYKFFNTYYQQRNLYNDSNNFIYFTFLSIYLYTLKNYAKSITNLSIFTYFYYHTIDIFYLTH